MLCDDRVVTIQSAEEFVELRSSEDPAEHHRAAHEEADVDVWLAVIRDYPDMRFWVAQNKTVPVTILGVLARDEDPHVRSMVASKRKLTAELFELLAQDHNESVRAAVAYNAKAPPAVVRLLLNDPEPVVRDAAASALKT